MTEFETRTTDGRPVVIENAIEPRRSSGLGWLIVLIIVVGLVVAVFAFGLVDIDQTKSGSLPAVKVESSGGALPKFNVDTAKVDVGTKTATVEVPTVGTKTTQVEVPTVSVESAKNPDGKN